MKYDEQGRTLIEPPEIPTEQLVCCIVKDYRRMYYENEKLKRQNEKLRQSLSNINNLQYAYSRIVFDQNKALGYLIKRVEDCKSYVPAQYRDLYRKIKQMYDTSK